MTEDEMRGYAYWLVYGFGVDVLVRTENDAKRSANDVLLSSPSGRRKVKSRKSTRALNASKRPST